MEAKKNAALQSFPPNDRRTERNKARSKAWKETKKNSAQPAVITASAFEAKNESPEAGLMYSAGDIMGSTPMIQQYSHNLDCSTFPLLCQRTYDDMMTTDNRLPRRMPFCMFLHHCTVALNAHIMRVLQDENKQATLNSEGLASTYLTDIDLPQPIAESLASFTATTAPNGDMVAVDIPAIALPVIDVEHADRTGTFGAVNAQTHNAYECYLAPRVTRRRVEATLANTANWTPLPPGLMPEGFSANENFLGFGPIDNLNPDGRQALTGVSFPADDINDGLISRLQYSHELHARVNTVLRSMSDAYKIQNALVATKTQPGLLGFLEVTTPLQPGTYIADRSAMVFCPNAYGSASGNQMYFLGQKRRRSEHAPGLCGLIRGAAPDGWIATRNNNFEAVGRFALTFGVDDPGLRVSKASSMSSSGSRSIFIDRILATQNKKK